MAQRRMFSPQIVESEEFLTMPVSSQVLYFHLGMGADDDGFIQPRMTMRTVGSSEDDLKVLTAKRFLLPFESGVVVIKHWLIHNLIQKDRYHPTRFQVEKAKLLLKDNKAYTEMDKSVNKMLPEVRLGKDRLLSESLIRVERVSDSDELPKKEPKDKSHLPIFEAFSKTKKGWMMHKSQIEAARRLAAERGLREVSKALEFYQEHLGEPYLPEIHTPFDLEAKWGKLFAFKTRV